jgi:WhiB family redox-sensing transcriptional regulator
MRGEPWRARAACNGRFEELDYFSFDPAMIAACKATCATCPSTTPCLTYALENGEGDGIWGGLLPEERAAKVRSRK